MERCPGCHGREQGGGCEDGLRHPFPQASAGQGSPSAKLGVTGAPQRYHHESPGFIVSSRNPRAEESNKSSSVKRRRKRKNAQTSSDE